MSVNPQLSSEVLFPDVSMLTQSKTQIDDKIEQNTHLIEKSLMKIEKLLLDLPSSDTGSADSHLQLEDIIDNVSDFHYIEKSACFDLDMDELRIFFNRLNEYLSNNSGSEEAVLNMLLEFCSHTGFTLPWKTSPNEMRKTSVMSLNVINDEEEQMCEALWSEVRRSLEDYIIGCLYQLSNTEDSLIVKQRRAEYVDKLHLLTTNRQLCQQYRLLRVCSLNQLINDQLSSEGDSASFSKIIDAFERIAQSVIAMIDNDFHLLISGVFRKISTTFEIISSIYFDKLTDELETVLDDLGNDVYGQVDKLSVRKKSDLVMADRLKDKLNKSKSRLDSTSSGIKEQEDQLKPLMSTETVDGIIRLAKALNTIDQHVYNLYLLSYTGLRGTSARSTLTTQESLRGVLKCTSVTDISLLSESITSENDEDMTSLISAARMHAHAGLEKTPQVVDKPIHHDKPQFLWQDSLKRFSKDLSASIDNIISSAVSSCVTDLLSTSSPEEIKLCPTQRGSAMEYPVTIYKSFLEFVTTLEHVLPLSQAGHSLLSLRQTFVNSTVEGSKTLLDALINMVERSVAAGQGHRVYLLALSCVALLRNTLYQCDSLFNKDNDKQNMFVLVYHQYCQAVDNLSQQYITAEVNLINNCILHDADSFNWSDNKEFFEDERCSFPIQAWSYHMQTIRLDLWTICPPSNASTTFSDILKQTLDNLTLRYMAEYPTYRRTYQYRLDIVLILNVVYELMFSVCQTSTQLLDIQMSDSEQPYLTIHSCCCKLLAQLAIVTSPLDELYKIYKKGYQKKKRRQNPDSAEDQPGYYSHWLSWVKPHLIPKGAVSVDEMQTTTALYIKLKLMMSQPEHSMTCLLQVLTMKDFTLPIMLLTQSNLKITNSDSGTSGTCYSNCGYVRSSEESPIRSTSNSPQKVKTKQYCGLAFCDGSCGKTEEMTLFEPFLYILSVCGRPTCLYDVILAVINRSNDWSVFSSDSFYQTFSSQAPDWFTVIAKMIRDSIEPSIQSAVLLVCQKCNQLDRSAPDITSFLTTLPCGCDLEACSEEIREKSSESDILASIIGHILNSLNETVACIPLPVCIILEKIGEEHRNHLPKPLKKGSHRSQAIDILILQVVGLVTCHSLIDRNYVESIVGDAVSESVYHRLQEVGPCLYGILSPAKDVTAIKFSPLHKEVVSAFRNNGDQYKSTILKNIRHRESPWPSLLEDDRTTDQFNEMSLSAMVNEILELHNGRHYLSTIDNVITNNIDWIYRSLDIHEGSGEDDSPPLQFIVDTIDRRDKMYSEQRNPLILYNKIGKQKFNFEEFGKHVNDWPSLLQSDLGLTNLSLCAMLQHRHDFQDGAHLEPQEKKHVDTLKLKFSISNSQ